MIIFFIAATFTCRMIDMLLFFFSFHDRASNLLWLVPGRNSNDDTKTEKDENRKKDKGQAVVDDPLETGVAPAMKYPLKDESNAWGKRGEDTYEKDCDDFRIRNV